MNIKKFVFILSVTIVWMVHGLALAEEKQYIIDPQKSVIDFSFKSTLHAAEGMAKKFAGSMQADTAGPILIKSGEVTVYVSSLDTGILKRDENMKAMLKMDQYPLIVFNIQDTMTTPNGMMINGQLKIKDTTVTLSIPAHSKKVDGGFVLSGETDVSLKEFSLRPPSVLMVIRVFDNVKVKFRVYYREKQ